MGVRGAWGPIIWPCLGPPPWLIERVMTWSKESTNGNGEIDELGSVGAPNWYPDADGDGFGGIGSVPFSMCGTTAPTGYAAVDLDCDDNDTTVTNTKENDAEASIKTHKYRINRQ